MHGSEKKGNRAGHIGRRLPVDALRAGNPHPPITIDEASGEKVPNRRWEDWEAGYVACLSERKARQTPPGQRRASPASGSPTNSTQACRASPCVSATPAVLTQ